MDNLLPANIIEIPLEESELEYFGALPSEEKGKEYVVRITPSFDFLLLEINGKIKNISLGNSERLEQELRKGKIIEMELIIGNIKVKFTWKGEQLAGGSKAMTMKIVEDLKIEAKKAMPSSIIEKEILGTISEIESNRFPFIAMQEIEIFKGSLSLQRVKIPYV